MRRAESWSIADILDFEYLLADDVSGDDAGLRSRDREIYERDIAPRIDAQTTPDRRRIFRSWLTARRAEWDGSLPGGHFTAGWQTLLTVGALTGLVLGISVTAGLLHYRGSEPVNVAWFFAATVGIQWLILVIAALWWLVRRTTGLLDEFRPFHGLMAALLWALSAGLRRLPGEQREKFRATLATLGRHREIYGPLTSWPILVVTQLFGVCFNVGVLGTLLLQISLSDVAFGWQSTLRTSPEEAFRLVSAVATPWAALPNPYPALDQVVASRFAYSAGIEPLSQTAMSSWWPFLCYSVAVYGLLVRMLLLIVCLGGLRSALRSIRFDHHGCNALFRRLTGPVIQAQGDAPALEIPAQAAVPANRVAGSCIALIAEDAALEQGPMGEYLTAQFGWQMQGAMTVQIDHPSGNTTALANVAAAAPNLAGVVVAIPARRAPIKAIALVLKKIAETAGGKETVVLLLGQRGDGGNFAPVTEAEFAHWKNFNAIHGLHLSLERWRSA